MHAEKAITQTSILFIFFSLSESNLLEAAIVLEEFCKVMSFFPFYFHMVIIFLNLTVWKVVCMFHFVILGMSSAYYIPVLHCTRVVYIFFFSS